MKRIISVFLTLTYLLFCVTAFADRYDDLYSYTEFIPNQGSFSADISLENSSNFEYLKIFDESVAPYSMAEIVSGIANSKIHIEADYKIQNRKNIKAYIKASSVSPIKMNDGLYIKANALFHIWVNMDFRNLKDPYYKITLKTPMSEKYFVFESTDKNAYLFYPAESRTKQITGSIQEALKENSRLTFENDTYQLTLDDRGFKNTLSYITENSYNYLYLLFNGTNADKEKHAKYKAELPLAMSRLMNVKLLGNSGFMQNLKFDANGKIAESELNLDISTNIFKVYYAITGDKLPTDPNVPRPIINVKNSDLNLKFNMKLNFSEDYTNFSFPRPSKKLTHRIFDADDYEIEYTTSKENVSPYEIIKIEADGFMPVIDGTPYIPLRNMLNALGIANENILWNDGNIEIKDEVVPILPFRSITLTENGCDVLADDVGVVLNSPLITLNSTAYVPEEFVSKILDATVTGYTTVFDYEKGIYKTTAGIERLKPVYYIQIKNSALSIID